MLKRIRVGVTIQMDHDALSFDFFMKKIIHIYFFTFESRHILKYSTFKIDIWRTFILLVLANFAVASSISSLLSPKSISGLSKGF